MIADEAFSRQQRAGRSSEEVSDSEEMLLSLALPVGEVYAVCLLFVCLFVLFCFCLCVSLFVCLLGVWFWFWSGLVLFPFFVL